MRIVHVRTALTVTTLLALTACATSPQSGSAGNSDQPRPVRGVALAEKRIPGNVQSERAGRSPDGPRDQERSRRSPRRRAPAKGAREAAEPLAVVAGAGPINIPAPKVVPIIFDGNPVDAQARDFFARLPGSSYWHDATAEYGVGPITTLPVYVPTDPAPSANLLDSWLVSLTASPPPGLPAPDDNTIYSIVLPAGWDAAGGACVRWGAYHSWTTLPSGQSVRYTVTPTCTTPYLGFVGIDALTNALSHELAETVTDPTGGGYASVNWTTSGWAAAAEGSPYAETGDMCEFQPDAEYRDPQLGYLVQRIWSNESAAGGHDPCEPLLPNSGPYFTAEPIVADGTQLFTADYARGVSVPPGGEVTIPVRLHSDGPMGEWQLSAVEQPNPHLSPDVYNLLSFSWDQASGHAGETRHLTIKRALPPDGSAPVFLRVAIQSTAGAVTHTWWLVVGTE